MASSLARLVARRGEHDSTPSPNVNQTHTPGTGLHSSARRHALTKFSMPAMSPTMTEGGIASWKKAEGEAFAAGDVLLEIVRPAHRLPAQRD
jgi:hypothetical protein